MKKFFVFWFWGCIKPLAVLRVFAALCPEFMPKGVSESLFHDGKGV
jgi:hypothetical protein